ncbi:E3 ubiquitin-protein ligase tom1 [Rhodotorula kratochvilovae]
MARLKRQPKRGGSAHPGIAAFIAQLQAVPTHELPALLEPLVAEGWTWPRTDLQHWIHPLNRFDDILEQVIRDYDLGGMEHAQTNAFTPRTKQLVLAVLSFEKLLLENSTNRKIFNGFDRLNDLLHTTDSAVLLATLRLALRPAQQYSSFNSSLSSIPFSERRLLHLAQPWGTREHGIEMVDLAQDKHLEVPLELLEPEWQFYRKADKAAAPAPGDAKDKDEMDVEPHHEAPAAAAPAAPPAAAVSTPAPVRRSSAHAAHHHTPAGGAREPPSTPAQPPATPGPATATAAAASSKPQEGLTTVQLPNFRTATDKGVIDALLDLVATHDIPERDRLDLLQKLRITHALGAPTAAERQELLVVRLLALAVYSHAQPEQNAQLKVFLYEPELIPQLAELVHPERDVPIDIKSAALYALEAFVRYKGKTAEVASALNASVSHGVLMETVRKTAADLDSDTPASSPEFVDALFNLLTYMNMHQTVGLMVIGAGVVSVLLDFVKNTRDGPLQMTASNKAVVLLDGFLYGYTSAFTAFMSAGGLTAFIERIKYEVETAIAQRSDEEAKLEPTVKENTTGLLTFQHATMLKNILRAMQRLMTTAGTTEGLRNLIDTPLLASVKQVMEHRRIFGPQVFSLATNIAATFVHNEPTSLATLQEAKVPDIFYDSLAQGGGIPASNDVLQAIPNAIGAFCLNQAGLAQFAERDLIPTYFRIFTSPDHFELLRDRDSAVVIGSAIDELVRHHPTLRDKVMQTIMTVFEDIKAWGARFVPPEGEQGYALVPAAAADGKGKEKEKEGDVQMQVEGGGEGAAASAQAAAASEADKDKRKEDELKDNEVTNAIDVFGRFLEGLFQNLGHTTDFLGNSTRAFDLVLDLLELPCCPAIMLKNSGYSSIVAIFRIASEIKAAEALTAILKRTDKWLNETRWFWDVPTEGVARESTLGAMVNPAAGEDLAAQQARFRALTTLLSHISLLSDVFVNLTYAHGKAATAILGVFTAPAAPEQQEVLERIGRVYRACQWENVTIRPTSFWTGEASKAASDEAAKAADVQGEAPTPAVAAAREHQQEQAAEKAAVDAISTPATPDSPNIKLVQDVIQSFTKSMTPLLQSIMKLLVHRRSNDAPHRKVAKEVGDKLARFLRDSCVWPDAKDLPANLAYSAQSFVFLTKLLFDERPNYIGLQTHLLRSFVACGGLDAYLELFGKLQAVATEYFASSDDANASSPMIIPVFGGLKTALELLSKLTSQKTLLEAPQTALLVTREKDPASPDFFDAHGFLVRLRAQVLPALRAAWNQPWLRKCPQPVVRSLVATLINIIKAEGEVSTEPAVARPQDALRSLGQVLADPQAGGGIGGALNALNAVLGGGVGGILGGPGTPPVAAAVDETRVSQLMDMGFPRSASETALRRCRNNVALATEYLLQHPDLVGAARDEEARQAADPAPAPAPAVDRPAPAEGAGPADAAAAPAADAPAPIEQEQPEAPAPAEPAQEPQQPDVEMGEASTSAQPAEEPVAAPQPEEPKGPPLEDVKKELAAARKELKPDFMARALDLAEEFGDLVFDIKSVFGLLNPTEGDNSTAPLKAILADLATRFAAPADEVAKNEGAAAARLRLVALVTTDPAYRESVEPNREEIMQAVIRCQQLYSAQSPPKDARPKWLAPLMLVADSLLSIQNVPKPTTILPEGEDVPVVELIAQGPAWDAERKALFDLAMDVLEKGVSTREVFISTARLLLVVTRDHAIAAEFVQRDGLKTLFASLASDSPETKGCHSYAVMILRHIVEDKAILRPMIEREIEMWFANSRSKLADITGFLRGASSAAFRDVGTFLEAAKSTVKLVQADAAHHYHVTLIKDPSTASKAVDAEPLESPLGHEHGNEQGDAPMGDAGAPSKAAAALHKAITPAPPATESTVHFLMQQVLDTAKAALAPIPTPPVGAAAEQPAPGEAGAAATPAVADATAKKDSKDAHIPADVPLGDFYQSAFSLACLAELVASYNPCKAAFLTFSTRKGGSKEAVAARSRSSFLYFLLNDLVPSSTLVPSLDFDSKRASSMWGWASLVIVGLCYDATAASLGTAGDKDSVTDITNVRKAVLDAIARAYRDAMASNEPTETRYTRLACLSDLCHRLLTARPFPHVGRPHSETSMQLAKLMLEKNFAVILTNALAEVDLNFPHVNSLINAILRPLENLTKVVTKLGRAKGAAGAGGRKQRSLDDDASTDASSMSESEGSADDASDGEQDQAAADLYRNSALGMYEGELETGHGAGDEYMSEGEEDFDDDDEMMEDMEDGFGSGSDISDASDLDDDDEDGDEHGFDDEEMEELDGDGDDGELSTDGSEGDHLDADDIAEEISIDGGSDAGEEELLEAFDEEFDGEEEEWVDEDEDALVLDGGAGAPGADGMVFEGEDADDMGDEGDVDEGGDSEGGFTDEEDVLTGELEFDPEMTEQLRAQSTAQAYGWDPVTGGDGASNRRNRALAEEMMALGDAGMFDRPRNTSTAAPHPLLVEGPQQDARAETASRRPRGNNATSRDSPAYQEWVRSVEQMLGPGGVNTLQEVLGSHGLAHLSGPDQLRIQLAPGPDGGMAVVIDPTPGLRAAQQQQHAHTHHESRHGASQPTARSVARQLSDRINAASVFLPVQTNQRWQEEGRILQGCVLVAERVARLANHLINALHGPAREQAKEERKKAEERRRKEEEEERIEEERLRKLEEELEKKEAERKALEEEEKKVKEAEQAEERRRAEEEARQHEQEASMDLDASVGEDVPDDVAEVMNLARSLAAGLAVPSTSSSTPARQATPSTSAAPAAAAPVASTSGAPAAEEAMEAEPSGSGAPRERVTVLVHGEEVDITDTGIDREFLEALPDDMRDEVIRQHLRESRIRSAGPPPPVPEHINSEFLDALPLDLRMEVLRQEAAEQRRQQAASAGAAGRAADPASAVDMDPASFLATLDPALRSAVLSEDEGNYPVPDDVVNVVGGGPRAGGRTGGGARRAGGAPEAGHAAAGGAPAAADGAPAAASAGAKKAAPQREVIQLLDKSGLATLVRLLFFPQPLRKNVLQKVLVNLCENARTRIELINLLLTILHDGTRDVSAVDKSFSQMSLRASRAVVSKDTPKRKIPDTPGSALPHFPGESVPNLIAQRCLEALLFLTTNDQTPLFFLTEQEVHVSKRSQKKGKGKEKAQPSTTYPIIVLLGLLERPSMLKTPAMMDAVTSLLAQITRALQAIPKPPIGASADPATVPSADAAASAPASASAEGSAAPASTAVEGADKEKDKEAKDAKDVANKADALVKSPPQIPAASLRLVVNVLDAGECSSRTFSQTLAIIQNLSHLAGARETILDELKGRAEKISNEIAPDLVELFETITREQPVSSAILGKFTPASSNQAKLLRILKTIDFFGTPKKTATQNAGEPASKTLSPEEAQVKAIYSSLAVSDLWKRLGDALGGVEVKPDLLYLSTVLLPLIESLLVVNKFTDASSTEFIDFTTAHSKILNTMVRNNPSLMSGSFAVLVRNSSMLDFENKRSFFFSRLHDRSQRQKNHYPTINLNVRRAHVFEDSFSVFQRKSGEDIKYGKLNVKFYGEEGVDAGGVTREWFGVLARRMFNPDYALFQPQAADALTYQPNKSSAINEYHLHYFRFVGRIIGKAIHDQRILEAYFSRSVYKHFLGKPVDHRDLESIDPEYYKSLVWMLDNDIDGVLDLTFSTERDEFGVVQTVDLIPNGRNIAVTNENKHDYVRRIAEQRLSIEIKDQMKAMLEGLYEIVPKDLLQIFSERELELLISGLPDLDVDEWRAHTDLVSYTNSDPIVSYFWRAVRSFSQTERAKLLQFVTGSSRVPLEGFGSLQGMQGVTRFNIHKAANNASLPTAHTCFNQLDLPCGYDSYEQLRKQLLLAITEGSQGFAFA